MTNTANHINPNPRKNPTKVVTGVVRLSYANVWEPKSVNGGTEKYSVSLIIPKSDTKTIAAINAAVDAAIEEGQGQIRREDTE
jgi:pectin methylesterase-like acyl-CoA thioesterase